MHRRHVLMGLGLLAVSALAAAPLVSAGPIHCNDCCPECGHKVCCPTPALIEQKKHCYQVDCKDICIPAIKWPFATCCDAPGCGRVRTVKVLKRIDVECKKCGYKWEVKAVPCAAGK